MIASYVDGSLYPDYDQYTVYGPEGVATESTRQLIMKHAANMSAKNNINTIINDKLSFDRSDSDDVTISANMNEPPISGVSLDGKALTNGTDFTINGNTVTISASYLRTLELKNHVFTLECTAGSSPKFSINVTDITIPSPTLDKYIAAVDKNARHYKKLSVGYDKKTSEFRGIISNGKYLTAGTDYTDNGSSVTFSDSYIRSLGEGNITLVFDFYEGADCELQLTVADTSALEDIDTFESYANDSQLNSAYTANTSGNSVTVSLVENANGKAMSFEYNVGSPNGYCGVNHTLSQRNVAAYKGVSITLTGDNSGNSFTLQFRDKNDNYFEKEITVNFSGEKTIKIPFDEFAAPGWQSGSAVLDTTGIVQVAFYAGSGGNTDTGTYIIDDVFFYNDEQEEEGAHLVDRAGTFNGSDPAAVLTKLVLNGQSISKITCNGKTLDSSTDYSWNGSQVTLNTPFTTALSNGKYEIVYHFSDGTTDTFTLTVINSAVTEDITVDKVTHFASTGVTDTSVSLAWDNNNSADGYTAEVYKGGKWNEIYSGTATLCTATDLRASSTYSFRIRAYKTVNGTKYYSDYTRLAVKTADSSVLSPVTSFTLKSSTENSVTLNWTASTLADGYSVEVYKGGKWNEIYNGAAALCTAADLKASSAYSFRIRAYRNSGGSVQYSAYVRLSAKTAESSNVSDVTSFRKISATSSELIIGWAKNNSAEGYIVEQYKGGKWTEVLRACTNDTLGFIAGELKANTTYTFRIRAYKTYGDTVIYSDYTRLAAVTNAS